MKTPRGVAIATAKMTKDNILDISLPANVEVVIRAVPQSDNAALLWFGKAAKRQDAVAGRRQ
ncbi:hypothetical protein [Mesorhizobium silamurunense]|uniref:hypothetical protein n=1 Tax=Mesorhizobium silamurunense TaxID=499528 RepID=UPI001780864A|nr:hypothetical protein [Mesorhizobium silamurunense]